MKYAMLNKFWKWAGITPESFADAKPSLDEYMFPEWERLTELAMESIDARDLDDDALAFVLTVMALDNETEDILDHIADSADAAYAEALIAKGVHHPMRDARWQTAELIRRRRPADSHELLNVLLRDSDDYVVRRASNSLESLVLK